jgi:hypothetical protein
MMTQVLVGVPTTGDFTSDPILELTLRGKSAINRAAIVPLSRWPDGPSGNVAINDASLLMAASPGNRVKSAASCQGSTSNRANAERTLSIIPFLSSPTGA